MNTHKNPDAISKEIRKRHQQMMQRKALQKEPKYIAVPAWLRPVLAVFSGAVLVWFLMFYVGG